MSSAKSRSSSCDSKLHCMPVLFPSVTSLITQSIMSRNRNGVSRHPCRPPLTTSKAFSLACLPPEYVLLWTDGSVMPNVEAGAGAFAICICHWHVVCHWSLSGRSWGFRLSCWISCCEPGPRRNHCLQDLHLHCTIQILTDCQSLLITLSSGLACQSDPVCDIIWLHLSFVSKTKHSHPGHVRKVVRSHPSTQRSQIFVRLLTQSKISRVRKHPLRSIGARSKRSGVETAIIWIFTRELVYLHAAEWRLSDILFWRVRSCVYLRIQWISEFSDENGIAFYSFYFHLTPYTLQLICVLFHYRSLAFVYYGADSENLKAFHRPRLLTRIDLPCVHCSLILPTKTCQSMSY